MKNYNNLIQSTLAIFFLFASQFLLAQKTVITYIHTDHLGSPIMATNEDGSVKWKEDYQPFGKQVASVQTDNNIGFTGHLNDKPSGLTYMKGRWYHPSAGRFMALDPVWYSASNQ